MCALARTSHTHSLCTRVEFVHSMGTFVFSTDIFAILFFGKPVIQPVVHFFHVVGKRVLSCFGHRLGYLAFKHFVCVNGTHLKNFWTQHILREYVFVSRTIDCDIRHVHTRHLMVLLRPHHSQAGRVNGSVVIGECFRVCGKFIDLVTRVLFVVNENVLKDDMHPIPCVLAHTHYTRL